VEFDTDAYDLWDYVSDNDVSFCCYNVANHMCEEFGLSSSSTVTKYTVKSSFEGATITSILAQAFQGTGLKTIELPSTIVSIGNRAFKDCPNLESLILNSDIARANVANYGSQSIVHNSPKVVVYSEYSFEYAFYNHIAKVTLQFIPGTIYYRALSFNSYDSGTTDLVIPAYYKGKAITSIASGFCVLNDVTSVNLPSTMINLPTQVFVDCHDLDTIVVNGASTTFDEGFYVMTNQYYYPLTMYVKPNSPAASYASSHGISYVLF
jgi:hypothetical protein